MEKKRSKRKGKNKKGSKKEEQLIHVIEDKDPFLKSL